jgi:hypothetical protein
MDALLRQFLAASSLRSMIATVVSLLDTSIVCVRVT